MKRLAQFVSRIWKGVQEKRKEHAAFEESVRHFEARQEAHEDWFRFGGSVYVDPSNKILGPDELPEELQFKQIL